MLADYNIGALSSLSIHRHSATFDYDDDRKILADEDKRRYGFMQYDISRQCHHHALMAYPSAYSTIQNFIFPLTR